VEQRVSNLAQGLLTLGTMTGPLLVVLHLIPQGVLAGLFFIMGYQALEANGVTLKILFLLRDSELTPANSPLRRIRRSRVWIFVGLALVGFGATFAITQTVAAVGFPVFIIALIPARALLLPKLFTPQELAILDAPTASPFTMESVGGTYGGDTSDGEDGAGSSSANPNHAGGSSGVLFRGQGEDAQGGMGRRKSDPELAELGESVRMRTRNSAIAENK
jgi:boron transporter